MRNPLDGALRAAEQHLRTRGHPPLCTVVHCVITDEDFYYVSAERTRHVPDDVRANLVASLRRTADEIERSR